MANTRKIAIVGAGGFAREVLDVIDAVAASDAIECVGFLADGDSDLALVGQYADYLGSVDLMETLPGEVTYVIGIGSGAVRRRIDAQLTALERQPASPLIHPDATVGSRLNVFGPGTVVCAGVRVTTNVRAGRHVHLNLNATVGHDAVLGDYVTVNPGGTISGGVTLEAGASLGTGAAIIQGVSVGADSVIGAGASVIRDVPAGVTAVGVPAKPLGDAARGS